MAEPFIRPCVSRADLIFLSVGAGAGGPLYEPRRSELKQREKFARGLF